MFQVRRQVVLSPYLIIVLEEVCSSVTKGKIHHKKATKIRLGLLQQAQCRMKRGLIRVPIFE